MERIIEGDIPERQIRRPDVSVALLEIRGTVPYKVDLKTISGDSTSVPRRKSRGLIADVLSGKGFRDVTQKSERTLEDEIALYMDICREKRRAGQKIKHKPREGYLKR